jgi:hypothetical protein
MSFTTVVSQYHTDLAQTVRALRGRLVTQREVRDAFVDKFPNLEAKQDWVKPSDHCRNQTNKGACVCAKTPNALFERVEWNCYRVL